MSSSCLFCKIIKGEISSRIVAESPKALAFLDVGPLAVGHTLVIPKEHGAKLHNISDEALAEMMPLAKKVVKALGPDQYNILQNNGELAHQKVHHVHFHIIPKPNEELGLSINWDPITLSDAQMDEVAKKIRDKIAQEKL